MTIQKFSEIKFAMAENLPASLKALSEKKVGLVAVKVSVNSLPKYIVDPVNSPTEYIKKLGTDEGITQAVLDEGLKGAFGSEED